MNKKKEIQINPEFASFMDNVGSEVKKETEARIRASYKRPDPILLPGQKAYAEGKLPPVQGRHPQWNIPDATGAQNRATLLLGNRSKIVGAALLMNLGLDIIEHLPTPEIIDVNEYLQMPLDDRIAFIKKLLNMKK